MIDETKDLIILTGMSGSGKTVALKILEDNFYKCIDNLPINLINTFVDLLMEKNINKQKYVLGIDIRSVQNFKDLEFAFDMLENKGIKYEVLFLDASDEVLLKRYKETRHIHPLSFGLRVEESILKEREELEFLKKRATYILDTSFLLVRDLKAELCKIFNNDNNYTKLFVNVVSFGFRYGIPKDLDLLFDVRFLKNPFYEKSLRLKTGEEKEVKDYVLSDFNAEIFLNKLVDMCKFLFPNYINEGKTQLVIGIGCTGGQHRSVTLATELCNKLNGLENIYFKLEHRDMEKNKSRLE